MWVKNWYGSYEEWRLGRLNTWGAHNMCSYSTDVRELLYSTMLEF